jgi:hypothetical protein
VSSDRGPASSPSYGHVCFVYDDPATFESQARAFLSDGLTAGERIWYVAAVRPRVMIEQLHFVDVTAAYQGGQVIDPQAQVAAYSAATRDALADGYTGLRVVADATPLVGSPEQLAAFGRYEHLADRWMCTHAFSAMCAFDRSELGKETVEQLACLHPETTTGVPFRLHADRGHGGAAALSGELDLSTCGLLCAALDLADLPEVDGEVVVQAAGLDFIDHRSLRQLHDYGCRRGVTVVLRSATPAVGRLARLLELSRVRVEATR